MSKTTRTSIFAVAALALAGCANNNEIDGALPENSLDLPSSAEVIGTCNTQDAFAITAYDHNTDEVLAAAGTIGASSASFTVEPVKVSEQYIPLDGAAFEQLNDAATAFCGDNSPVTSLQDLFDGVSATIEPTASPEDLARMIESLSAGDYLSVAENDAFQPGDLTSDDLTIGLD